MPRYLTDRQAADIPTLQNTAPEDRAQLLEDASRIQELVTAQPWIDDQELRQALEREDRGPDRATAALELLCQTGQLVPVPDSPVTEDAAAARDRQREEPPETS